MEVAEASGGEASLTGARRLDSNDVVIYSEF